MAVEVELPRRLFTVEEYHRMAEAGILGEDERVELIEGEIVQMAPIGPPHFGCVINATRLFITRLGDRAVVSPQNPVVIRPRSEPQPDLVLLRPRAVSYSRARAGIPELWLCLARDGAVEVHRAPGADGYASVTVHGPDQMVSPLAFPDVSFAVTDFFA